MDQQLKQLMKELGEAINESLADSEPIADVVSRIKEGGYDIFLVLEATIGVSKPGEKSSEKPNYTKKQYLIACGMALALPSPHTGITPGETQ